MQKKLIALAVAGLMSGAAFAQSNVTISGNFDAGLAVTKAEGNNGSAENGAYSNSSTSQIFINATEDMGGGMKAGIVTETSPISGAVGASQRYIWLSGNFGQLSIGQRNNFSLTTAVTAQPFGTAMGGGYSGFFSRLNGIGMVGATTASGAATGSGVRDVRVDGSVRYDSPNMSGFTVGLSYDPQNKNHTAAASNNFGHLNVGLNYGAGPLKVSYAYAKFSNPTSAAASIGGVKHNLLGANYSFGAFTLYGGYTTSKGDAAAAGDTNARSTNIGLKYAMGNIAVMANITRVNDKMAADVDRSLNGLGLDYSLSKRTTAYVRYENGDHDKSGATGSGVGKFTNYAVGLRHTF